MLHPPLSIYPLPLCVFYSRQPNSWMTRLSTDCIIDMWGETLIDTLKSFWHLLSWNAKQWVVVEAGKGFKVHNVNSQSPHAEYDLAGIHINYRFGHFDWLYDCNDYGLLPTLQTLAFQEVSFSYNNVPTHLRWNIFLFNLKHTEHYELAYHVFRQHWCHSGVSFCYSSLLTTCWYRT